MTSKANTQTFWIIAGAIIVLLVLGLLIFLFTSGLADVSRWFSAYKPSDSEINKISCENACQNIKARAGTFDTCNQFKSEIRNSDFNKNICNGMTCTVKISDGKQCSFTKQ